MERSKTAVEGIEPPFPESKSGLLTITSHTAIIHMAGIEPAATAL